MAEIRVGKPDVKIDTPSHTKGVEQGNAKGSYKKQAGHHKDGTADTEQGRTIKMNQRWLMLLIVSAGLAALFWKEGPALARYIKMERM